MNFGWPEGILVALFFLSLVISAVKHGEIREPPNNKYNFPIALTKFILFMFLLYIGGFFA